MAISKDRAELLARPPIPFLEGQTLGSQGLPLPQEVANSYLAYLDLLKNFPNLPAQDKVAYHRAAARASSRSVEERGLAQSDMEKAVDAAMTIEGYVSSGGLVGFLSKIHISGEPVMSVIDMVTLNPALISASADGMHAYRSGYDLQSPTHLEDGQVFKGNISVDDAHKLGFIVRAATLGIRAEGKIPADLIEWRVFEMGKNLENGEDQFNTFVGEAKPSDWYRVKLHRIYMLGQDLQRGIQAS